MQLWYRQCAIVSIKFLYLENGKDRRIVSNKENMKSYYLYRMVTLLPITLGDR